MSSRGPNSFLLAILLFALNLSLSPKSSPLVAATPTSLINKFCNRKDIADAKPFCFKLFESDPRSATATNDVALFKIALEKGSAKVKEIEDSFSAMANTKPEIKATLESCVNHFKLVANTFQIYYKSVLAVTEEIDVMSLSYDFDLALIDANKCGDEMASGGVHDVALSQQSKEVADYFTICYGITKVVTKAP